MHVSSDLYVPTFSYSLEQTYKLAMANDEGRRILSIRYGQRMSTHMDPRLETSLILIKQGLRNPETRSEVIEACVAL